MKNTNTTEVRTFASATITGFNTKEDTLRVFFQVEGVTGTYSAIAHKAFKVAPHIGKAQQIEVVAIDGKWRLLNPRPSQEEIEAYEAPKPEIYTSRELTKEDLAFLTF